jgi:iron complex outermembrane receptor protein
MKQLLLILTVIFSAGLTAQEIKVSGVVTDGTKAFTRHINFS